MRSSGWFRRHVATDSVDQVVESYLQRCETGATSLEKFWGQLASERSPTLLSTLIKLDIQRRFDQGERPMALEYLEIFPVLSETSDRVISLIYEEFCLLEEHGDRPDSEEFCDRYEAWRDPLSSQLVYHRDLSRVVTAETPTVNFPSLGERFDKYRLDSILGDGGVARVYLATEVDLGGRRIAIKVSNSMGQEPAILGKLDHRNIVPILTVAQSASGLRGICMPYRPGLTLEALIRRIGRGTPPRSARAISEAAIPREPLSDSDSEENRAGWANFPIRRTFPEAVAWIGVCLADALCYLHKQGVCHRDIKPANILLAYREGPQLLDFNLAQDPSNPENASAAQRGGTLPYMAPEQLKAFLDPAAWDGVGPPADLYSLGLVLRELLTGQGPAVPSSMMSLPRGIQALYEHRSAPMESTREINPAVPPALESIIEKCLSFDPSDRYESANDLAVDLRCFLDRKPLLHAPNSSKVELCVNWIYRNRQHLIVVTLFLVASLFLMKLSTPPLDSDRWEFQKAEGYLDSGLTGNLQRAKADFEDLRIRYPHTARSALGLAMTLKAMGSDDTQLISDLCKEAINKKDAESVIMERLEKHPKSAPLLTNLGLVLTKKNELGRAREALNRSLEIDPEGITASVTLASLDRQEEKYEESASRLASVIELCRAKGFGEGVIYGLRLGLLQIYLSMLDRRVDQPLSDLDRRETASYLEKMTATVRSFDEDCRRVESVRSDTKQFHLQFFRSCLTSLEAAMETDPANRARRLEEARLGFEQARLSVSTTNPERKFFDQLINDQMQKREQRRQVLGTP